MQHSSYNTHMEKKHNSTKYILLTSASFAGFNIGSGFATGIEALQFFGSWGSTLAFVGIIIATAICAMAMVPVYISGYEQHFEKQNSVYHYYCGDYLGVAFDYYMYIYMAFVVLMMMSGAGATVSQLTGLPVFIGTIIMGVMCILTALLKLEKIMDVLSSMCIFICLFIVICWLYVVFTSGSNANVSLAKANEYVSHGELLRSQAFGVFNPYLSAISSGGMLVGSGFTWASATGALAKNKKEAVWAGILSSVFYYTATAVVVYLILNSIDDVAGKEVPMLSIIQRFMPKLSWLYSLMIILAIYATISGRLFLIADRFDRGNKKLRLFIVTAITVVSALSASFIRFSVISNIVFSVASTVGVLITAVVIIKYVRQRLAT